VRAIANSWKREPFTIGAAIPYQDRFSESEYAKLQEGLIPGVMEDKWFLYFEEPYFFLYRSWTGQPVYRARSSACGDGATVAEALYGPGVLEANGPVYQARLLDFLISNVLFGKAKPFPVPDGFVEQAKGAFQHAISGTGYPQVVPEGCG
jgi:hypothetical protein